MHPYGKVSIKGKLNQVQNLSQPREKKETLAMGTGVSSQMYHYYFMIPCNASNAFTPRAEKHLQSMKHPLELKIAVATGNIQILQDH